MYMIRDLTIEYRKNPIGIDEKPRFSWKLESEKQDVVQTSYQIQVVSGGQLTPGSVPEHDSYSREEILYKKGLVSASDYEKEQQAYLASKRGTEQMQTTLSSARIQEAKLHQTIVEIQLEQNQKANSLQVALQTVYDQLQVSINNWKLAYLFTAPTDGILSYNEVWQKNQNITAGDKVFSVVAENSGAVIGKAKLPVSNSGKVKSGQRVNIRLTGYPYMEYGFLTGKVSSISLLSNEDSYTVTVELPDTLQTSYNHILEFQGELSGSAEVLTDERSFTARLLSPLRYLWEKYSL